MSCLSPLRWNCQVPKQNARRTAGRLALRRLATVDVFNVLATIGALLDRHSALRDPVDE